VWVEMVEAVWREAQTPTFNDLPRWRLECSRR
jgi:hypothetical protein